MILLLFLYAHSRRIQLNSLPQRILQTATLYNNYNVSNYHQFFYTIDLQIGNPPQQLKLHIDTGSSVLWVLHSYQIQSSLCPNCTKRVSFNITQSNSTHMTNKQQLLIYGKGKVKGKYAFQTMALESIMLNNVSVLMAQQVEDIGKQTSGLIGLSNNKQIPNFLDIAYEKHLIKSNKFALQLHKLEQRAESYLHFDQIPQQKQNEAVYFKSKHEQYWTLQLREHKLGNMDLSDIKYGLVDSGTSNLIFPTKYFKQIYNTYFKYSCIVNSNSAIICDSSKIKNYPTLTFSTQNIKHTLTPQEYLQKLDSNYSVLRIGQLDNFQGIILGDVFMTKYFFIFDKKNNKIGIAKQNLITSNLVKLIPIGQKENSYIFYLALCILLVIGGGFVKLCFLLYKILTEPVQTKQIEDFRNKVPRAFYRLQNL